MLDSLATLPEIGFFLSLALLSIVAIVVGIIYMLIGIVAPNNSSWANVPKQNNAQQDSDNIKRLQEMETLERAARLVREGKTDVKK